MNIPAFAINIKSWLSEKGQHIESLLAAKNYHRMKVLPAPRLCIIRSLFIIFPLALLFAGGFIVAAKDARASGGEEGVRYVFVKVDPEKQPLLDEIKNSHDAPLAKFTRLIDGKHPAVVRIDVEGGENVVYHGSGTLVDVADDSGIVLTNWHVVRDAAGEIRVRFPDGTVSRADVLESDKTWDLAALAIARPRVEPVKLAKEVPQIGDALTIVGYGEGSYRQAAGRLLQFCAPGMSEPADILEITTPARNGDSGGPIFSEDGRLAGVIFGSASGATNGSHSGRVRMFLRSVRERLLPVNHAGRGGKSLF